MATYTNLYSRLRALRIRAGLSQEALARRADLGNMAISRIEREEVTDPRPATLIALASALGVPLAALIGAAAAKQITGGASEW